MHQLLHHHDGLSWAVHIATIYPPRNINRLVCAITHHTLQCHRLHWTDGIVSSTCGDAIDSSVDVHHTSACCTAHTIHRGACNCQTTLCVIPHLHTCTQ